MKGFQDVVLTQKYQIAKFQGDRLFILLYLSSIQQQIKKIKTPVI